MVISDRLALDVVDCVYDTMVNDDTWSDVSTALKSLLDADAMLIGIQNADTGILSRQLAGDFSDQDLR